MVDAGPSRLDASPSYRPVATRSSSKIGPTPKIGPFSKAKAVGPPDRRSATRATPRPWGRLQAGGASAQYESAEMTSPPPMVPRARQVTALVVFLAKWTLPSANRAFTPPEW